MEHAPVFDTIRREFCSLFSFKSHPDTLEVITPLATMTNKFVSVFIVQRGDAYKVTDGGWIEQNVYEHDLIDDEKDLLDLLNAQYQSHFDIHTTVAPGRGSFYFKSTKKMEMIPALVFDVANFIVAMVNANAVEYRIQKEKEDRDRFRAETGEYLKATYGKAFKPQEEISKGLRFNGVIRSNNRLHLLEFVTGSTARYFENELRRSIVNFDLVNYLPVLNMVGSRIAILNDQSLGFQSGVPPLLIEHLQRVTNGDFIRRSNLEEIRQLIPASN